jgi:hypothetical protein
MLKVTLSKKELFDCQRAANGRSMLSRASGVVNQRKDKSSTDQEIDLIGIKGELAVSKVYQADFSPFDFGVDAGVDMFLGDVGVDVKTTKYATGVLLFKSVEAFKAPIAILCTEINHNTMAVIGWIKKTDFAEQCQEFINPKTNVHTDGMCVEQSQLKSPEELWLELTRVKLNNQQGDKL